MRDVDSRKCILAGVLLLVAWNGPAEALPVTGAFATTYAQWGVFDPSTDSVGGGAVAQPADGYVDDPYYDDPTVAGALARASVTAFPAPGEKSLRSASFVNEAGGHGTSDGMQMLAFSLTRVVTEWVVTSDGTYTSTTVPLDTTLAFDGTLYGNSCAECRASVQAMMNVYLDDAPILVFDGLGVKTSTGFIQTGAFANQFFRSGGGWGLDYENSFDDLFTVNVGQVFVVDLMLQTGANGNILDGEYYAHSDFYNSGGFQLSLGDIPGLTLTQLGRVDAAPEPEISALLAAGFGLLEWLRRRHWARARSTHPGKR